jgi:hypothetical protein
MTTKQETITKKEAVETLDSIDLVKRDAIKSFRPPLPLIVLLSLSYSLIIFSWGMTEHENMWALGMYIGVTVLLVCLAFYFYTFRLLGVKLRVIPRTKKAIIIEVIASIFLWTLIITGREIRLLGFEFAPHVAALIGGGVFAYLLYKYPTGEYLEKRQNHD